jgi:hypothetical protein
MKRPKYFVGDIVIVTASGVQGIVSAVDVEADIYTVECPGYTSSYTRPMLKLAPAQDPHYGQPEVYGVDWNF